MPASQRRWCQTTFAPGASGMSASDAETGVFPCPPQPARPTIAAAAATAAGTRHFVVFVHTAPI